jgi:SAM-dependent methyltransferase
MTEVGVFADYARYYDLLYAEKDYGAEADYVDSLIRRWRPGARTVIEFGSGTGKHAALLAEKGYAVHGIERSAEMLGAAEALVRENRRLRDDCAAPTFSLGDIRTARLAKTFDAAISLFHVLSYQTSNEDLLAALRTARQHLAPDGVFVFDVWYGPAVLTDRPAVRVKRMAGHGLELLRIAEPRMRFDENCVEVDYHVLARDVATGQVSEADEIHLMRYLFSPEVSLLAAATDFSVEHAEEWLSGRHLGCDTWGACFVLRAR